jgi:ATP synthase protein I
VYRIVQIQLLLTLISAIGFQTFIGAASAVAALYGGWIALVNSGLVAWYQQRAEKIAGSDARRSLALMASCATQRLVYTVLFFAAGMGPLKLEPLALLSVFVLCQILVFIESARK